MKVIEERKTTRTGAARYKAGVLKYAQMGYWNPDYVPAEIGRASCRERV